MSNSDGGTIYLMSKDKKHISFEIMQTDSLKIAFGGRSSPVPKVYYPVKLFNQNGKENLIDAIIYGSAVASFTVSQFSVDGLRNIQLKDIEKRAIVISNLLSEKILFGSIVVSILGCDSFAIFNRLFENLQT